MSGLADSDSRRSLPRWSEVTATACDITNAKLSDELLRESEERLRTLADLAPAGIFMTDPNGNYIYVNR